MDRKKVLIVGGYGTVGKVVAENLAKEEHILPVIAGRSETRARALAAELTSEWRTLDIHDEKSIPPALEGISLIINCFSGPFTYAPIFLAEQAARNGIHYLDVSGSYEYAERFLQLAPLAAANRATLITALGANPGIPGIAIMAAGEEYDRLETGRIEFALGSAFHGISAASLKELKYMLDVPPLVWERPDWVKPRSASVQQYMGAPFEKEVYLGASLTRDLLVIPELTGLDKLSFWSGSQSASQGLAMILGLKLGLTKSETGARFLLNLLKQMGRSADASPDVLIRISTGGRKNGAGQQMTMELYCEENYATALAPVIVCRQIIEGKITKSGAFVPPEAVPAADFMERLGKYPIHLSVKSGEVRN